MAPCHATAFLTSVFFARAFLPCACHNPPDDPIFSLSGFVWIAQRSWQTVAAVREMLFPA